MQVTETLSEGLKREFKVVVPAAELDANPKVTLPTEQDAVEKLISGQSDLDYTMAVEIVPPIELTDFKTIKLTKLTSEVTDAEVDEAVARISEQNKPYSAKPEGEK